MSPPLAEVVDQALDVVLDLAWGARDHERPGHVAPEAEVVPAHLLELLAVGAVEVCGHHAGRQFRQVLQARRVVALEEGAWGDARLKEREDHRLEAGPVILGELLVVEEAGCATVQRDEHAGVPAALGGADGGADDHGSQHPHQRLQLLRLPVQVERAAAQAAIVVGDRVEGRLGDADEGHRVAHPGHLAHEGPERGHEGPGVPAHLRERLEHGRHRRRPQERPPGKGEVHGVDPPHGRQGELAEHAEGACEARPQGVQGEPGRVGEEGVVLVGLEVLVLDPLELDVVRQVAAGPADLLGSQRFQRPGWGDGHAGRPVPAEADRGIPQAVEVQLGVVPGILVRHAGHPGVEVLERQGHQRDAVGLAQGDRVFEPLQTLCEEFGVRPGGRTDLRGRHTRPPLPSGPGCSPAWTRRGCRSCCR